MAETNESPSTVPEALDLEAIRKRCEERLVWVGSRIPERIRLSVNQARQDAYDLCDEVERLRAAQGVERPSGAIEAAAEIVDKASGHGLYAHTVFADEVIAILNRHFGAVGQGERDE